MALVAGEAGSGKTTLVRAFKERVADRILVLEGACDPLTTPRPLSPVYEMASDPGSGLGDLLTDELAPIDVFARVLDRLKSGLRPLLVLVEDVHWADESTNDFLRFLGRRIGATRAVLVCTYRDDEVGSDHPLRSVLGQLISLPTTRRLPVPPLSEEAVADLIGDEALDPHALHQLTGGNAFYVTEVIAAGGNLPATVQDAVLARVALLPEASRRVVEAVSVAPRSLEVDRAMQLLAADPAQVDAAVSAGVLLGDGYDLRFRHELARSAVEDSLPPGRRLDLHRRMLSRLEEDEQLDLARLAHHAIKAEAGPRVAEYAPRAATEAARRGSRKEAVSFYRAALSREDHLDDDRIADLRVELAIQLAITNVEATPEGLDLLDLAIDHYRNTEQVTKLAEALGWRRQYLWHLRRIDEGWEAIQEAIAILRPLGPTHELGMSLYRAAHHQMLARHRDMALRCVGEARQVATLIGDDEVVWSALMMTGCIEIVLGDPHLGAQLLTQAWREAVAVDDPRLPAVQNALSMLGSGGGEARLYDDAKWALEESVAQGLATDQDYSVAYSRAWLARIAFEEGRWDEAVAHAEMVDRATEVKTGIAYRTAMGAALGRVRVRRGDPGGKELLEAMVEAGLRGELQHVWSPVAGLAEYHWLRGDHASMVAVLEEPYRRALGIDSGWARGELGFWMWKAGAIGHLAEGAAEPYALHINGDWRGAAEAWGEIGCPYEVGMALLDGDEDAVLQAVASFDGLGARPGGDLARERLRAMGVSRIPRRRTRGQMAGLTPRQHDVLRLIIAGKSNAEIASELYLSKKTVEHHVSAVFSALGVTSRTEAVKKGVVMGVTTQQD